MHLRSHVLPQFWPAFFRVVAVAACALSGKIHAQAGLFPELNAQPNCWVNLSSNLLADFARRDLKPVIKFAYDSTNGAGICGILADRSMQGPWIILQGQGLWQHAGGESPWARLDQGKYDAFYENAGPDIDPAGRGLCLFSIQGSTIDSTCARTRDGGKTWTPLTTDRQGFGYDTGAVDWAGGRTILARKHHTGDLMLSRDAGQTWTMIDRNSRSNNITVTGLIGADVLIKGISGGEETSGLYRSVDGGTNWSKVATCRFGRVGHTVIFHDTAYATTTKGILISRDQGAHWSLPGDECPGLLGPVMFGADENHLMVYGSKGFSESLDGGKTWKLAVAFGDDKMMRSGRFEYGIWNPADDTFFITHISGQAFGYRRKG